LNPIRPQQTHLPRQENVKKTPFEIVGKNIRKHAASMLPDVEKNCSTN
jgi:hypothetical protein